jgi:ABC-type Fe3+-hydroxamate transport system substrate-binding protein
LALKPDLVLMNDEENRRSDYELLRGQVRIYRLYPQTVPEALRGLGELVALLGAPEPEWLQKARAAWDFAPEAAGTAVRAVIPVWRKPWIVLGRDTFAGDVLRRLGVGNVFGHDPERYPRPTRDEILARRPELVVLPDEPYNFTAPDGPRFFPGIRHAFLSGRHLTWYGPSLAEAPALLRTQLCSGGGS